MRRNPDPRARRLEVAWRAGDLDAGRELAVHLQRSGGLTLEWIADLGELCLPALSGIARHVQGAAFVLAGTAPGALGAKARFFTLRDPENWFPGWTALNFCPKGHDFEAGAFVVDELCSRYHEVGWVDMAQPYPGVLAMNGVGDYYDSEDPVSEAAELGGESPQRSVIVCCTYQLLDAEGFLTDTCLARWPVLESQVRW